VFLLFFLTLLSLVNYFDRGAFVGVLPEIQRELDISDANAGIIGGAFVVGYALVSPFVAQLGRHVPSGILLMFGMICWVVSTCLITFSQGFWYLIVLRCLTGIGEAAFICLSPALIDDVAPASQKTRWLAIFFSALPIGYSLGYLGAGLIVQYLSWRWLFFLEASFTLPFALMCFFLPNVRGSAGHADSQNSAKTPSLLVSIGYLARNSVYICMTLGYSAQTFVLGALTYWLPKYVVEVYKVDLHQADYIIGATTAFCGIFANVLSSFLLDYVIFQKKKDKRVVSVFFSFFFVTISLPFGFVSIFMSQFVLFLVLMVTCEFLMLCTVTSVNSVFLNCVKDEMRGHSMAVANLMIHVLGDLWSPYVFGAISDKTSQKYALFFICCWLMWTVLTWLLAFIFVRRSIKLIVTPLDVNDSESVNRTSNEEKRS